MHGPKLIFYFRELNDFVVMVRCLTFSVVFFLSIPFENQRMRNEL